MILSTDVWVSGLIRRAQLGGAFPAVLRKGDPRAGAVIVRVFDTACKAARLYVEAVRADGERVWMHPAASRREEDIDAYVERAVRIDPDLWVVEIEDREGRHFLTEPVDET